MNCVFLAGPTAGSSIGVHKRPTGNCAMFADTCYVEHELNFSMKDSEPPKKKKTKNQVPEEQHISSIDYVIRTAKDDDVPKFMVCPLVEERILIDNEENLYTLYINARTELTNKLKYVTNSENFARANQFHPPVKE